MISLSRSPAAARAARPAHGLRAAICLVSVMGVLLASRPARAADIALVEAAHNSGTSTRKLRIPAIGDIALDPNDGYVVVGIALSDIASRITDAILVMETPRGTVLTSLALKREVTRDADLGAGFACRTELWSGPVIASSVRGHVDVTIGALTGTPPAPNVAGTIASFNHVASTSLDGPCCANAGNDGSGNSTISKTMNGSNRGDALFNTVCTSWTGAAPGMPTPDPVNDPEMVPRSFVVVGSMQHFTGTSPGGDVAPPATSHRSLRWLQSGSRVWALNGVILLANDAPNVPDAGVPVDAAAPDVGPAPIDTRPPNPAEAGAPDTASAEVTPMPADAPITEVGGGSRPDAAITDAPAAADAGPPGPTPISDASTPGSDGGSNLAQVAWRVGCACDVGQPGRADGAPFVAGIIAVLALLHRRASRRR
jgi:hypothetical protein